jgi:putative Ca2+/H+ antiporter (TMEM165/GDT1 family)
MLPFLTAFILIAVAELGDKTQLLTLALNSRYGPRKVLQGSLMAILLLQLLAVAGGRILRNAFPKELIQLFVGVLFIGFAVWMLSNWHKGAEEVKAAVLTPLVTVFVSFFLAELGDKTQLATAALAARQGEQFKTWLGASLGMFAVTALTVFLGTRLQHLFPEKTVHLIGALLFAAFGLLTLVQLLL